MPIAGTKNESNRVSWIKHTLGNIKKGSRLLDAGAGEQQFKKYCSHLDYVAQDFGQYDGSGDNSALQTGSWDQSKLDIISDITSIPELDNSFDAILCTEVFEHLPDPLAAIAEFSRLLKRGGKLIITAPFCSLTHFAPYHFASGFNRYFYETHLPSNGLTIEELTENGNYFEYIAQEVRRIPDIANRYTKCQPNFFERLAIKTSLKMLERFSRDNQGSEVLLCYGFHVLATKQ